MTINKELININNFQENFRELLDIAEILLVSLDKDSNVQMINKKGCKILGYEKEEIIGKNWLETFIYPEDFKSTKKVFDQLLSDDISPSEYNANPIKTKNGKKFIKWHNTVLKENGEVVSIFSSGEDVTEITKLKDKLQKQAEMFGSAFRISPVATCLIGPKGRIIEANEEFEKLHKISKKQILKKFIKDFISPPDMEKIELNMENAKKQRKPQRMKIRSVAGDKVRLCDTTVTYIDKNGSSYYITQWLDITGREKTKSKIAETMKGLRTLVG